ncbi:zinc finger protein 469 [Lissotriton helveticus]
MTGETQHAYAISSSETGPKHTEKEFSLELFVGKDGRDMDRRLADNSDLYSRGCNNSGPQFAFKDKEPQNQREAVIRPQQAGKIDFKSLYNRPKFSSDGIWNGGKIGPLSPNGKSRAREKAKRSGKGDRTQHQLYRLSISNSRPNPTIGIAYPQQKVTPPKKPEVNSRPISGSYGFPVSGIPERETEVQQDDLSFHRCFQEVSSSLTSTNSTSQPKAAPRQHHSLKLQQATAIDHEGSNTNEQLHFLEFPATGTDSWHSPEKKFTCATYGVSVQKAGPFSEGSKSSQHSFGPVPYQYSFQSLCDANPDAFCNEATGQDYLEEALATNHAVHGGFAFHSSSADGLEKSVNGAFDNLLKDNRTYALPSQQTPFFHTQQALGAQHPAPTPCYKGRNEHSTDLNGAISSSGAITSSGASDQTLSTFQDSKTVFSSSNFSLHSNSVTTPANKRQPTSKDSLPNQIPPLRRNMPPSSLPQVPFQSKGYSSSSVTNANANAGPVPFDKSSLPTAPSHAHMWDGESSAYLPIDQNTLPYPPPSGSQFTYQCQSNVEQRHMLKSSRMSWQQGPLTSVVPNQNRTELSRQLESADSAFPCNNAEWRGANHMQNNYALNKTTGYHNSESRSGEEVVSQSKDSAVQNCGSNNNIYFQDSVTDTSSPVCDPRNKTLVFSMNQSVPVGSARNASNQTAALPLLALVTASPSESPLSSPVPNTLSSSTCSSLSPLSSSPNNPSSEENQLSAALTSFYNQSCHPKENKAFHSVDSLHPSSLPYHQPDSTKTFSFPSEVTKDEHVSKFLQEKQFHKQNNEAGNGCINHFENEPPPPPYSSHHLLANSLSSASLDQLDVLLTCKQCDQNYSNLSSFLEHRQYCGLHSIFQSEVKESSRGPECRKVGVNSLKPSRPVPGVPLPKGSSDMHLHVQATNKCSDFLLGGDGRGDTKEELLKANLFNGSAANLSSVNASDLDIDEAKLDSLITEALNGLGYQSDNPEIDSSFMDAFVDEELSMIKSQPYKIKDNLPNEGTLKAKKLVEQQGYRTKNVFSVEKDNRPNHLENNRSSGRRHGETKGVATKFIDTGTRQLQPMNVEDAINGRKMGDALCEKKEFDKRVKPKITGKPNNHLPMSVTANPLEMANLCKKQPNRKGLGSWQKGKVGTSPVDQSREEENRKPQRAYVKDKKKRKPGTWSKELIQKIVQQKNKHNKLHVKSDRSTQVQPVTEAAVLESQSLSFGEYDYVSDSDDDVEYGKRKANNQPKGTLKYTFTSKHCGLIEKTKEVTAWKCSKTKEIQKDSRDSDSETAGNGSYPLRVRRRSSRSSSSSVSSEIDQNCKSTDLTDSGNEKEVDGKRKYFHKSNYKTDHDAIVSALATKDFSNEKRNEQSDVSRVAKRLGSAKFLLADPKVCQGKMNVAPASSVNEATESPARQKQFPFYDPPSNHPEALLCQNKSSDKDHKATSYTDIDSEYQSDMTTTHQSESHQFPVYSENTSDYAEELTKSIHVANTASNAVHDHSTETGMSYSKEYRLCDDPKDFQYYNQDPLSVDFALTPKVCGSYSKSTDAYEQKDVLHYYDSHLFAKPLAVENNSCTGDVNTSSYEHKVQDMVSFKAETAQKKVGSPLNFDSVSVFGEIPVSEYDNTLYSSVSVTKDNFVPYTGETNQCSKTLFDHQFAPFIAEKDWELMHEMSPLLSQDHFHNPENKEHNDICIVPSEQMSSETIASSHVAFMNSMSVDELAIKRLVTELETQLQTNQPSSHVLAQPNSENVKSRKCSKDSSQYSTPPSNHTSENAKSIFSSDVLNNLNSTCHAQTMAYVSSNLEDNTTPHPTVNECYETPKSSWNYTVPFDSIDQPTHQTIFKGSDSLDTYAPNEDISTCTDTLKNASVAQINMSDVRSYESQNLLCDVVSSGFSDEDCVQNVLASSLKCPKLTPNEPPVPKNAADRLSNQGEAVQPICDKQANNGLQEQTRLDKSFDDPPKLDLFQSHASNFQSQFDLQEKAVPLPNKTSTPQKLFTESVVELSSRALAHKTLQVPAASNPEESSLVNEDRSHADSVFPSVYAESDDSRHLLFDIPNLDKEEINCIDRVVTLQGSAANPLQELQLFVARTAKTNEEEMLMPCFPGLLSAAHATSGDDGVHSEESDGNSSIEKEIPPGSPARQQTDDTSAFSTDAGASAELTSLTPELREGKQIMGIVDDQSLTIATSCTVESPKPANGELQTCKAQQHHLRDEYSELGDLNSSTDAISQNHDSLLSFRDATQNLLTEEAQKEDQIVNLLEADENQAALTFQEQRDAAFSNQVSFEIEPLDSILKAAPFMCDTKDNLPCDNLGHDESLSYASPLDCSSTQTEMNNGREEEWPLYQGPPPREPHDSCNLLVNENRDNLLTEESIYPKPSQVSIKENTQVSEILSTPYCSDKSSDSLHEKSPISHSQLATIHPESPNISDFQVQLSEKPVYGAAQQPNSNSELLAPLTQSNFDEAPCQDTGLFPLTPPDYNSTVAGMDTSIGTCLADNLLNNIEQSEQGLLLSSHALLCTSDNGQLKSDDQFDLSSFTHSFPTSSDTNSFPPPSDQKEFTEMLSKCANHDLALAHHKESEACSSGTRVPNLQLMCLDGLQACHSSPDNSAYSTLSVDLFTEMNDPDNESSAHLQPKATPEECFGPNNECQKMPQDTLNSINCSEEKSTYLSNDLPDTADLGHFDLNDTHMSEAIGKSPKETSTVSENIDNPMQTSVSSTCVPDHLDPVMNGVLNILNCEKSKAIFRSLGLASGSGDLKARKAAGLQVTCDICSASFRSKPGLTRHKACKHQTKHDDEKVPTATDDGDVVFPKKACKTSKTIASKILLPKSGQNDSSNSPIQTNAKKLEEQTENLAENSNIGFEPSSTNMLNAGQSYDSSVEASPNKQPEEKGEKRCRKQNREIDANDNPKKTELGKVKKRKVKAHVGTSADSHAPSDEILNIIKTNILKAIICPKPSSSIVSTQTKNGSCESQQSCDAVKAGGSNQKMNSESIVKTKKLWRPEFDGSEKGHKEKKENIVRESPVCDQGWIDGYLRQVEQNVNDESEKERECVVSLEGNQTLYNDAMEVHTEDHNELLEYEPSSPVEIQRTLRLIEAELGAERIPEESPKNLFVGECFSAGSNLRQMQHSDPPSKSVEEADIQSLFDDDITFSMLFPRDDHFNRRKCTRVYGKRNKNLTPVASTNIREVDPTEILTIEPGSSFITESTDSMSCSKDDHSRYETISINDSLMLDICHRRNSNENDVDSNSCETVVLQTDRDHQSPGMDPIDMDSETLLNFLCQNHQAENTAPLHATSSITDRPVEHRGSFLTKDHFRKSSSETEDGHFFRECSPEELDREGSRHERSPSEFHTIDIEFLSAKLETGGNHIPKDSGETFDDLDINIVSPKENTNESPTKFEEGKTTKSHSDVNLKTKNKQYKCKACFQWFHTLGELNHHKFSHNPCPPPTCYMCVQRKFSSREQLKDHLREKHAKNKAGFWVCGMCLKEISDVWMYNEHLREHATQFARKGQAQSVLGLHGCFADEAAVHTFLTRFIYRKPNKSDKHSESGNTLKTSDPEELVEHESKTSEEAELGSTQSKLPPTNFKESSSPPPELLQQKEAAEKNSLVQPNLNESHSPLSEFTPRNDAVQKNAPIHPLCKDPSRDCHHCGKQFPKPFKLQRHLVVHSLQKIFLCHKCPVLYQDVQELRSHIRQQHKISEDSDIKHTTLYACEMCADVMHVIKKSFICSACNYTFSKKEQYDRHMEKHLVGGSKTFRFRRVRRPDASGNEVSEKLKEAHPRDGSPPNKKRRHMPELSPVHESYIISPNPVHTNHTSDNSSCMESIRAPRLFSPNDTCGMPEALVKLEDEEEDFGNPFCEMEESLQLSSMPSLSPPMPRDLKRDPELDDIPTLSINEPSKQDADMKPPPSPFPDLLEIKGRPDSITLVPEPTEEGLLELCTEQPAHIEGEKELPPGNLGGKLFLPGETKSLQDKSKEESFQCTGKKSTELIGLTEHQVETNELQKVLYTNTQVNNITNEEVSLKANATEVLPHVPMPLKEKAASSDSSTNSRNHISVKKGSVDSQPSNRQPLSVQSVVSIGCSSKLSSSKEKASPDTMFSTREGSANIMKEVGGSHHKTPNSQPKIPSVINTVKCSSSNPAKPLVKPSFNNSLKTYVKKRKDHLTLDYKCSSSTREKMEGEGKMKNNKVVVVGPGRNDFPGSLKKHDRTNAFPAMSLGKEGTLSKGLHCHKPKPGGAGSQIKKLVIDTQKQKKVEGRQHSSGVNKGKKELLGKTLHQLLPKGHSPPLQKHKIAQTFVKPTESPNPRTAESQNNLLSKLFGQKLTSFKIPLRRDTSE